MRRTISLAVLLVCLTSGAYVARGMFDPAACYKGCAETEAQCIKNSKVNNNPQREGELMRACREQRTKCDRSCEANSRRPI